MLRFIFAALLTVSTAYAQNTQTGDLNTNTQDSVVDSNNPSTTNNYNGAGAASNVTPPPTAVAPSVPSGGTESCLIGRSFGTQVNVLGLSFGGYKQDDECNRRRDARALKDQGMSIAAVARLCHSVETWIAMFESGTPCPFSVNGKLIVGRAAFLMMKRDPDTFIPDYGDRKSYYDVILQTAKDDSNEESSDTSLSISERFRSSRRPVD
tara:strand:+ start:270 stop:896 length:627 start_codon:yes stop_codon:yes gene_type:complete